jgi:hypothetical protein
MPRVKLNQPVNVNGIITTCAELLDSGNAIVEKSDGWYSKRSEHLVTKYLVKLLDTNGQPTSSCFEIGQKAYESRVARGQHVPPVKTQEDVLQAQETPITLEGERDQESQSYIRGLTGTTTTAPNKFPQTAPKFKSGDKVVYKGDTNKIMIFEVSRVAIGYSDPEKWTLFGEPVGSDHEANYMTHLGYEEDFEPYIDNTSFHQWYLDQYREQS